MGDDVRGVVLNLMGQKAKIEDEIKHLGSILQQNGIGMNDPLVDSEGFPLAHVDIYQVRNARKQIICLQNDHKAIMKQIEKGLGEYYEGNSGSPSASSQSGQNNMTTADIYETPFAKIVDVIDNSPAYESGLENGDLITQFGSVNNSNFKDITTIAGVVQHCQNTEIKIQIVRGVRTLNIRLRPHRWVGTGLLGCKIVAIDQLDR